MNVFMIIEIALERIKSLSGSPYINLSYYSRAATVFAHLEAILNLFKSKKRPAFIIGNRAYFLLSHRHIKKWAKAVMNCGGNNERWQSHKVFLKDIGLIETLVVSGSDDDPKLNRIWLKAQEKGHKCETLWTVPLYNEELLQRADRIAGLYRKHGVNISHLRKNLIIRFRGQNQADWLYWPDCRTISDEENMLWKLFHDAINIGLSKKGYTTFKEVESQVRALLNGREHYLQVIVDLLNPDENANQTMELILQQKTYLCHECGCRYHQIKKEDRERLSLPQTLRCWIITQM